MNIITGGVTAPKGFQAAGIHCGIKDNFTTPQPDKKDLAMILSSVPCAAAGTYTRNVVKADPVILTKEHLADHQARGIIFDSGNAGRDFWRYLKRRPERGLRPVSMFALPTDVETVRKLFAQTSQANPKAMAMILQKADQGQQLDYITEASRFFERILIVPSFNDGFRAHWLTPRDLGATVGLQVRQNLRDRRRLRVKRFMDVLLCAMGGVVLLPLGLILALAIRLDSRGPVFYRQRRIGRGGREIRIFKFRTMVQNADEVLKKVLERNPELRAEWDEDHKLKNDPRVTRVGHFLRKMSLDELPQLFNILRGEMSFVGPRPLIPEEEEIRSLREASGVYRMRPGVTGLAQVNGRDLLTAEQKVAYDAYYVEHHTLFMDIRILFQTIAAVLTGKGFAEGGELQHHGEQGEDDSEIE